MKIPSSLFLVAFAASCSFSGAASARTAASAEAPEGGRSAPAVKISELKQISPQDGFFHGWPTLLRMRNGTLMVALSGGRDSHACPFGRVEVMYSRNDGATWSWPQIVLDTPIDDRDAGLLETARGTLLLTTFKTIGFTREGVRARYANDPERWERYMQGFDPLEWADRQGPMMLRSEDGGRSWSAPAEVPMNSPHGPLQLADGRLLFPGVQGVGKGRFYKPGERRIGAWESRDDGLTWRWLAEIPARPGDDPGRYHELHGVQAADGTIVVHIRSHDGRPADGDVGDRHLLQTVSKDGGRTWSVPRPIGVNGYPPHLLRLRDDRLLLSYDRRTPPFGIAALVSSDHGETWSEPLLITKNEKKFDQGYPSTAQLEDGSLLTVWYEVNPDAPRAILRQAKWSIE